MAGQQGAVHPPNAYRINNEHDQDMVSDPLDRGTPMFMAVSETAGRVGLAWYEAGQMCCMEGQDENAHALLKSTESAIEESSDQPNPPSILQYTSPNSLVQLAKLHVMPTVIYVSSKASPELIAALKAPVHSSASTTPECDVRLERAKLFSIDSARAALEAVHLPEMPIGLGPRERLHILNTTASLCREQQVCAVGALLSILARQGLLGQDPDAPMAALPLTSLKEVSLQGHLLVDPGSLEALHIFREEAHPSAMGIGRAKEGLSVFGMMNRCVSPPGRRLLKLWFARPLVDVAKLEERLDGVEALMRCEDASALKNALRAVKDPCRLLMKLQGGQTLPDPSDFLALQSSLDALLMVRDVVNRFVEGEIQHAQGQLGGGGGGESHHAADSTTARLFQRLVLSIQDSLIQARHLIASVIDPEQSQEGMTIHYGVSQPLDEMKELYYGLPDLLRQVELHEISRLPRAMQNAAHAAWSVAYVPQVGFLLQVEGPLLGAHVLESLPDIQLAMAHGIWEDGRQGACYFTDTTRDLTERYGDVLPKIRDMETMICNQVAQKLNQYSAALHAAVDAAAELDCLLSLAEAAAEMNLVRPKLTEENVLEIKGGRHLLAEAVLSYMGNSNRNSAVPCSTTYIPNDTTMQASSSRVHVISGPNLSGKSLYAKQVAIITFLAHVGSFVPAEKAVIGLTDRIFTRVVTRESGAVPQSAFLIDLTQVASMLRLATPRSLLIIDEFGKGTLAADGVGLLCGALAELAARQTPPKVLLTTHFTEVLNPRYLARNEYLAFYTMAVTLAGKEQHLVDEDGGAGGNAEMNNEIAAQADTNEDLVFLYRLVPGHVGPSFGIHCAAAAGVNEHVVARARQIVQCIAKREPIERAENAEMNEKSSVFRSVVSKLLSVNCSAAEDVQELIQAAAALSVE